MNPPHWHLTLHRRGSVRAFGGEVLPLGSKAAGLLAYLAVEGPTPRSTLAGLLWPEVTEATARNNLSQALGRHRDLLNSVLEANLTQVGLRQNEDMRKISAWVAIGVVPTLLAGIYGMNLEQMPLIDHSAAFPVVVGAMVVIAVGLFTLFRRRHWL